MKNAKIIAMMLAVVLVLSGFAMNAMAAENKAAAPVTPSVAQKGVPELKGDLVIWDRVDGKVDLLQDKDKVVKEIPADKLALVAFGSRAEAGKEVKEALENAYKQIVDAKALTELSSDLEAVLKETGLKADQLVVRDLIDITLDPEYAKILAEEPNYIALSFALGLEEGETLIVLHNVEGDQWETISGDSIAHGENGETVVAFDSLSPVAFVVAAKN